MSFYRRHIFIQIIATLIFISAGAFFYNNIEFYPSYDIKIKKLEKQIVEKQNNLKKITKELCTNIDTGYTSLFNKDDFTSELKNKNITVLIYRKNDLIFWSDNKITYPLKYVAEDFDKSIISLFNAYVLCETKDTLNYHIIALSLIKTNYPYENNLINNYFNADFDISSSYNISLTPNSEGFAVTDVNGNFLFSLIPDYTKTIDNTFIWLSFVSYLLAFLSLLILYYTITLHLSTKIPAYILILATLIDLFLIRFLMTRFSFPSVFYQVDLFNPQHYASSKWIPSFGDYILNTICFFVFALIFFKLLSIKPLNSIKRIIYQIAGIVLLSGVFILIVFLFQDLIANANIPLEFYNLLSINFYSILLIIITGGLISSYILIAYRIINELFNNENWRSFLIYLSIPVGLFLIYLYIVKDWLDIYSALIFLILNVFIYIKIKRKIILNFSFLSILTLLISLYIILFINHYNTIKERQIRKVLAVNLSNEHDYIGELQLSDFEEKLKKDKTIIELLKFPEKNIELLNKHVYNNYFHGYWSKYDFKLTTCKEEDSLEVTLEDSLYYCNCFEYFGDVIFNKGYSVPKTSNFYFIENDEGRIRYIGRISYMLPSDSTMINIYLDMTSKLISTELGYPELLLKSKKAKSRLDYYSYAKYKKGLLVAQSGNYSYNYDSGIFEKITQEYGFLEFDGYNHLIYNTGNQKIIISKPIVRNIDIAISLAYVFIIFLIFLIVYFLIKNFPYKNFQFNLKTRIQFVMISLLLFSMIIIGGGAIYYNLKQYEKIQIKNISEKTQSVLIELEHKVGMYKSTDFINNFLLYDNDYLNYLLVKFSNVFYSDINLYDTDGNLIASSRMEIFDEALINKKMNPTAFYYLNNKQSTKYIHKESIGKLDYISSYVPFRNQYNELIGYINLPYFTKQSTLRAELFTLIVAIVNSYLLLFIITAFLAVLISNNVTRPLRMIQKKFKEIQLGARNETIDYQKQDEIGELIQEYNRMVKELEKSAELLAKSERESAWREMAKQIAHEIKNPLTPMKLSVQHLIRAWNNKDDNYEELHKKVTTTLIEQIDTLSSIASAFSMFAKLPKTKPVALDIVKKIESTAKLFDDTDNIVININKPDNPIFVLVDKDEIMRVFNNLIKNAIQAIPNDRQGKININFKDTGTEVIISISDNGIGISDELKDKLFQPNFTTKSGGMGLGLAIVQSIIEESNGDIWFETVYGEGTTFFIRLPKIKNNGNNLN